MEAKLKRIAELEKEIKYWSDIADANKLSNNGTFGKLFERFSCFYAPTEGIQVTLTGQLALLMLIEQLELCGISVVSANTDGIVIHCDQTLDEMRDIIIKDWESITNYEMEKTEYSAIYARDVNNYIAIPEFGAPKCKGVFAEPKPTASNWPAPSGQICVDAILEHLETGRSIESVILSCTDIRQFIYVRAVKGGGALHHRPYFPKKASKKFMSKMIDEYGFDSYDQLLKWSNEDTEYLGKTVRWYYARDCENSIRYAGSGNLVARAEQCQPLMELPCELPDDVDYAWYINEAKSMLISAGGVI